MKIFKNIYNSLFGRRCNFCERKLKKGERFLCQRQLCLRKGMQLMVDEFPCIVRTIFDDSEKKIHHKQKCEKRRPTVDFETELIDMFSDPNYNIRIPY